MARQRRDQNSRMLHLKARRSRSTVLVFHTVVFLALIHSCRGQSQEVGPSQPIVATVGEDIILPCYLNPVMNAFDMTVEWARPDLNPRFVLVWRDGVELESKKHPSYEGRTSVFIDKLQHGNISLKLSKVKISDEGTYRCFLPELVRDSLVQLVVGAASSPVIQETRNSIGELQCESEGWYPEPEVFWLDGEGHLLSAGPTETVRGPDGLYTVSSTVTVEKRHGNSFTCRVQQKTINQTRDTQIHVKDHFFMVPSTPSTPESPGSPHVIIGSIIGCAALVFILAVVFVVWKWRQKKFKNKRRSCEDGAEQSEEEKVTSTSDNTGFQVVTEGEGESVPLMAGREEEENNVDNRAEERIESQSERKDQFVAERETQQDPQPEPIRDVDGAGGERNVKSINNEKVPLIPTETHQKQDMIGRQVRNDCDKGEGEQRMKPVKEDSGLPVELVTEGQKEQQQNLHTDQEVKEEEETRQEPMNDDKKEAKVKTKRAKKENKQGRVKKGGSGSTGQKKQRENQREPMQLETERQKVENERKLQSEMQKRTEREKDEIELTPHTGHGNQHVLEDKKQEGSKTEPEDKKEKDQEGNQSNVTRTTERKDGNQKEQSNEELKETEEERMENERELQSDRQEKIKKDKERTEEKRDEREKQPPSVSREVTERPDLRIYQETAGRKNQEENELQAEKQEEETSQRNQEETKEQPERSTERVKVERPQQAVQQLYVKEEIRKQPEESSEFLTEKRVQCQEAMQEEPIETDTRPDIDEAQRKVKRRGNNNVNKMESSMRISIRQSRRGGVWKKAECRQRRLTSTKQEQIEMSLQELYSQQYLCVRKTNRRSQWKSDIGKLKEGGGGRSHLHLN